MDEQELSIQAHFADVTDPRKAWNQDHRRLEKHSNERGATHRIYGRTDSPAIQAQIGLLREARAVIVATPVYKASLSGVLKTFLDLLPPRALSGKLVLPLATGGSPLHALAVDYALLPVLAALGAQHTLNSVYLVDSQIKLDEVGLALDVPIAERLDGALQELLEELGVVPAAAPLQRANGRP